MSIDLLKQRNIKIAGIIFNGEPNPETESIILKTSGLKCIGKIPQADSDIKEFIRDWAEKIELD